MQKKITIILFTLFILFNCNNYNLGNNIYVPTDYEATDIGFSTGSCIYIGYKKEGYSIFKKILIYADVISWHKKSNQLFVKQNYNEKLIKLYIFEQFNSSLRNQKLDKVNLPSKSYNINKFFSHKVIINNKITRNDSLKIIKIADSLLIHDSYYIKRKLNKINYYILNIKLQNYQGPYNYNEFLVKLDSLKLPNIIKKL